eukprot:5705231-Prymnesium_polylepis.2
MQRNESLVQPSSRCGMYERAGGKHVVLPPCSPCTRLSRAQPSSPMFLEVQPLTKLSQLHGGKIETVAPLMSGACVTTMGVGSVERNAVALAA